MFEAFIAIFHHLCHSGVMLIVLKELIIFETETQ